MAISKLVLNGETQMDVTSNTNAANNMLNGIVGTKNDGTSVTGNITSKSSSDLTASGATVTAPAGYYSVSASKSVTTMTLPTSTSTSATSGYTLKATLDRSTSDRYLNISPGYNSAGGYYKINKVADGSVTAPSSISGTSATVSTGTNTLTLTKSVSVTPNVTTAGYISSGTAGNSSVSLTASVTTKGAATITPSTSEQSIAAGTYLTGKQTISAMPSGTAGTPTASKGSVSNNSISVTPSVTNTTGYITGGTKTGTAVTVSASELVSGTKSITENGTGVDVTNYASVDVDVVPNLVDLEIEPSYSDQTFDGNHYVLKQIDVLQGSTPSSSTSERTVTIPIDLSKLEYGQTYYLICDYIYVYQGGQRANIISINTEWTASENGSVDFVYNEHLGAWNITSVTLSRTAINFTFDSNMGGLTVHTINDGFATPFIVYGICDGYKIIYARGAQLQDKVVTPSSEIQTIYPDSAEPVSYEVPMATPLSSNPLVAPVDLSFIEYGKRYKVTGSVLIKYNSSIDNNIAYFDTTWTAYQDGDIPFTLKYTDVANMPTRITLSTTEIKVYYPDDYTISRGSIANGSVAYKVITFTCLDDSYYGLGSVTVEAASSQLTYGTFTITADSTTTEQYIGFISMCKYSTYDTNYYPGYVATKMSGSTSDNTYKGRWIINPSDGYMYVTFVGGNDSYSPNITATSGTATWITNIEASSSLESKSHYAKVMRVYKISDGAVLTASYVNNS